MHLLTSYPPSNLNRDDLGRPKTAKMGGKDRLRISSQSLKRAWRTSDLIEKTLKGHIGTRSRRIGKEMILTELPTDNPRSAVWANDILAVYGEPDDEPGMLKQLVFVSPAEEKVLKDYLQEVKANFSDKESGGETIQDITSLQVKRDEKTKAEDKKKITNQIVGKLRDLLLIGKITSAFDVAMFGRMLASSPAHNIEAAVQVAHAITVHEVAVEDDYFTAVDDLNKGRRIRGLDILAKPNLPQGCSISTSVLIVIYCLRILAETQNWQTRLLLHWWKQQQRYHQLVSNPALPPAPVLPTLWQKGRTSASLPLRSISETSKR